MNLVFVLSVIVVGSVVAMIHALITMVIEVTIGLLRWIVAPVLCGFNSRQSPS